MVEEVKKYTCDACGESKDMANSSQVPSWTVKTDVGDLCPKCASAWETWKHDFIECMRVKNGKPVVDIPKIRKE